MSGRKGFTLIELLIVVSLLGIVSLAVFSVMSGGVRIWKRMESEEKADDLVLAWKRLQKDIRGQLKYRAIPFDGQETEVSFPALVSTKGDGKGGQPRHDEIGRIRYYRNEACRCLCREKVTYLDLMKDTKGECLPVFPSVTAASFEYYGQEDGKTGPGGWYPEWSKEIPPLAVRLKVTLEGDVEKQFTALLP